MSKPPKYFVGGEGPDKQKIAFIYGQTDRVVVYRIEDETVVFSIDADELSDRDSKVQDLYYKTRAAVFDVFGKEKWKSLQDELAICLYNGLTTPDEAKALLAFEEIHRRTTETLINRARLRYLLAAFAATGTFFFIGILLYIQFQGTDEGLYSICVIFSVMGAFASIISRTANLDLDPHEDKSITMLRGIFRIVLAVIFTAFMIAAAKANLIAGIVTSSLWAFIAYSFLCGFSERFAPEMLASFEKGTTQKPNAPK